MEKFQASRNTIRLALAALANEGLVATEHGRGTFVRERRVLTYHAARAERADRPSSWQTDAYFDEVREAGREPSQTFSLRIEPAGPDVCARLHIEQDKLVVLRKVVRYLDGQPWSDQDSWYPVDVAEQAGLTSPHDLPQGTIRAMANAGHVEIGHIDELTARMPSPDEVRTLSLAAGVPVMVYVRTAWTNERPVRVTHTIFPADRNRIVYELGDLSAYEDEPL
jgi:GntR family transcriptional regulator